MRTARRIIRILRTQQVFVEKRCVKYVQGGCWGECDEYSYALFIGKHLCETSQVKTLIHESLHFLNPAKSERWVCAEERKVFDGLLHSEYLELAEILRKAK